MAKLWWGPAWPWGEMLVLWWQRFSSGKIYSFLFLQSWTHFMWQFWQQSLDQITNYYWHSNMREDFLGWMLWSLSYSPPGLGEERMQGGEGRKEVSDAKGASSLSVLLVFWMEGVSSPGWERATGWWEVEESNWRTPWQTPTDRLTQQSASKAWG